MNRIRAVAAVVALMGLLAAHAGEAQQIRTRGHGEPDIDQMVKATLLSSPLIIARDTFVRANDTIHANVVVVNARLVLEGTIAGDLTGLEANMYLRPSARVDGRVLNVVGGLYPSELAHTGSIEDRPLAPYRISRTEDGYLLEGTIKRPQIKMLGAFQAPEYNRVDGLRVEVGPSLLLPSVGGVEPTISGSIGYATARKQSLQRARLTLQRGRSSLSGGWDNNITLTNEEWIRSAFKNSIAFIWNAHDYRNYYQADRTYVEFRRILERGARTSEYWVRGQNETASPLIARDPFTFFGPDTVRTNPLVPASRIASAIVGARTQGLATSSFYDVSGSIEMAGRRGTAADYAFNAYDAHAEYAMKAIANHTLQVNAWFRGPLPGTDALPLQRWTFVGGSNTLYTYPLGEFPGDRVAFFETTYGIPLPPRVHAPLLGTPTLRFMHNIGMAWSQDTKRGFEQNVGIRVQFPLAYVRVVTDPRRISDKVLVDVGVSMPAKGFPWEKPAKKGR